MTKGNLLEDIRKVVREELVGFATKDDLKGFATRDDLKGFATRDDLKGFPTKDDLKVFATKDDIKRLERKIESAGRANIQHHLRTREEIGYLNDKFGKVREGLKQAAGLG